MYQIPTTKQGQKKFLLQHKIAECVDISGLHKEDMIDVIEICLFHKQFIKQPLMFFGSIKGIKNIYPDYGDLNARNYYASCIVREMGKFSSFYTAICFNQNRFQSWYLHFEDMIYDHYIKGIVAHEYAHYLDLIYGLKDNKEIKKLYNTYLNLHKMKRFSSYAETNIQEFIADCWSVYVVNEKHPEIVKKVSKIILENIK